MSIGAQELLAIGVLALLLFAPALALWWGGYAAGRRRGRSEAASGAEVVERQQGEPHEREDFEDGQGDFEGRGDEGRGDDDD